MRSDQNGTVPRGHDEASSGFAGLSWRIGRDRSFAMTVTSPARWLRGRLSEDSQLMPTLHIVARLVALGLVAVTVFPAPPGNTRNMVAQVVGIAVAVVTIGLMTVADRDPSKRVTLARPLIVASSATAMTCGVASLTTYGGPFSLLSTMATIWAGNALSLGASAVVTGAGVVAIGSVGAAYGVGTWDQFGYPILLVIGMLFGRLLRGYRMQVEQSQVMLAKADQLRQEQGRAATLDERNRIAREIHDVLAHSLGALGVQIQAAQAVLTDQGDIGRAVELLGQARRMATDGLTETRRALQALRADTPPLPEALAQLSVVHQQRHHAAVSFRVTGSPRALSADAGLALTRTAQEALVNAAKYAPYRPVAVWLDFRDGRTALTIANELDSVSPPASAFETANGGYGLAGMRERLRLIDGQLVAGPQDGRWVVTAEVPQ